MRYELKPLGVGGILDQTILIFKDRFGLFLVIVLCLRVPATAAFQYLTYAHGFAMPMQPTDAQAGEVFQKLILLYRNLLIPWLLVNLFVISPLTDGALIYAAARIYLGQPITLGTAFRAALSRYFPFLWTSLLFYLILFVGWLCCFLPAILFFLRFSLVFSVVVLERLSGFAALERSGILMRFDPNTISFWPRSNYRVLMRLFCVAFVIQAGIGGAASLIGQPHLQALVTGLVQSVASAFWTVVFVIFYFSCRCRAEGFDLIHLARVVAETPADQPIIASQE
jgi:hypothetical protein